MFAAETKGILVILQGMDASGKESHRQCLRRLRSGVMPGHGVQGAEPEEEAHHFLWRPIAHTGHGELVIFDRSYTSRCPSPGA